MDSYVSGTQSPGNSIAPDEPRSIDQEQAGYRYGKALCETAKGAAGERAKQFKSNWDYLLGKDHWAKAASSAARQIDSWAFKGVVNWTYATVKTKASMICSAPSELFCDPLDDQS